MNCKNCNEILENDAHFCDNCGAKVIKNRITFKFLMIELFAVFGIDSLYLTTLRKMFTAPQDVMNEYLQGVRRRYINPFAYLAVGAALSLIIFNYFSDDYLKMQSTVNQTQVTELKELAEKDLTTIKNISEIELNKLKAKQQIAKKQLAFMENWVVLFLRYFNIMTFLLLPFYALLSKLTYTKPHNFGEHIVSNAYIQGTSMYISIIAFFLGMIIHPNIFLSSFFIIIIYYLYVFNKLYKHSFGKSILKLLRFIGVLILLVLILTITFLIIGVILGYFFPQLFK
ncbi:DUF3667 domain-containing protein [uncultured Tenacibaculum sp.]|uniref:DUF3667 domain-containing protein n=1 Tax=uncultured Tenacibaculum sp. TaxID=174713 RepID=UPI0026202F01|nr:DUF3667 domain-containing protein [uncultured Tenacibaculum sp.]